MRSFLIGMAFCCATLLLTACENQISDANDVANGEALQEVSFRVLDFEQTLKQMGVMEADTRASLSGNATYLKVALFSGGSKKYEFAQTSDDDGFGVISALVLPDDYAMVVIASKVEMAIDDATDIYPTGGKLNDTFYSYRTLTKDELEEGTVAVALHRAVALLEFKTDAKPSEVTSFTLEITGVSTKLNAVTGLSAESTTLACTFDQTGRAAVDCGMYMFLPSDDANVTVKATAYDGGGGVVKTYTFTGVQMKPAYHTCCSGNFFQIDADWSVTIDDVAWSAIAVPYDLSSL